MGFLLFLKLELNIKLTVLNIELIKVKMLLKNKKFHEQRIFHRLLR